MAARNQPDAAQTHDVAVTEPATAKEASVPASTSTQSVQHTEVMGTHIELDTSRDDSNLSSSSPSRDRENDTRNPEDATSVQSLKESEDINRLSYPPSFFKFIIVEIFIDWNFESTYYQRCVRWRGVGAESSNGAEPPNVLEA
ncbi:hypothetical protein DAPPUDRAFT_267303 [Daphnia pulex]|uniref:Uncharacterized protein n=1 Tax=Daphnia pulex TaxID=6669 RepID=E9HWA3_DAPPU|nr:hypothetical protein DAPPUDRAFT_267303 [Daphnia pulex]|eukprot:EFX63977.1 hypothetical protein DAPPUDRAFT_267303 [Daphnia pulex]